MKNTVFETNFTVMPPDANFHYPLIFGGAFGSEIDLCAYQTVNRFLYDSECDGAVTHKWEIEFSKPTYVGDLIFLRGEVVSVGEKSIVVEVKAERERKGLPREPVASAKLIFVSVKNMKDLNDKPNKLPYHPHGVKL